MSAESLEEQSSKMSLAGKVRRTADALRYSAGLLLRHAPVATVLLVLSNGMTGLATPVVVWSMNGLVTVLGGDLTDPWLQVWPWLALLSGALILRSADEALTHYLATIIRQRVDGAMYRDVTEKAIRMPLSAFENRTYYNHLETGRGRIACISAGPFAAEKMAQRLRSLFNRY